MNIHELKTKVELIISDLKNHGKYPNENNLIDYKSGLNLYGLTENTEIFLMNFVKDIISFSNAEGGIILLGFSEDKTTGIINDIGLSEDNLSRLNSIDLSIISSKFNIIVKVGISIDLQQFQISTRKFYYLLIEKQHNVIVPVNDFSVYKIKKGDIIYRTSSKNETANSSTQEFNRFLQLKANEKSKDFMEIWSKLLPEMVDINPREVLIINPLYNKVYGFNGKDNILSSSDIEIDKTENGVFNVILNAISAGEIGKITTNEGKPLYKIVGEIRTNREYISLNTLEEEVKKRTKYKFSNVQLKAVFCHLKWVTDAKFKVDNPVHGTINNEFNEFIWVETKDKIKQTSKVVFSSSSIDKIVEVIDNESLHQVIFNKNLVSIV